MVYHHKVLMREVDENGDMHINFPQTKAKYIETSFDKDLEEVLKNVAYLSSPVEVNPEEDEEEPQIEEISINADLLQGKTAEYFEKLSDTTDKDWKGNPVSVEHGGTGLSAEDIKPNTILFVDENNKIKLLEPPVTNSILAFVDGKPQWVSTISVDLEKPDTEDNETE